MKARIFLTPMQWAVCAATAFMLSMNIVSEILPLNGKTTAEIAMQFKVFFMPAGYVFSIWGLIYVLAIFFTVFQASQKYGDMEILQKIRPLYILSTFANISWLVLWHYEQYYATLISILVLLVILALIYRQLEKVTVSEREVLWGLKLPFSIYLAWICVATIANITVSLHISQWYAFGIAQDVWAALLIGISSLAGTYFVTEKRDPAFAAVILWSIIGIGVQFYSDNVMIVATFIGSLILFFLITRQIMKLELPREMAVVPRKKRITQRSSRNV